VTRNERVTLATGLWILNAGDIVDATDGAVQLVRQAPGMRGPSGRLLRVDEGRVVDHPAGETPGSSSELTSARLRGARPGAAEPRWLHRLVGREELRNLAVGQLRPELCARLTEELAVNHGDRREDRRR
jgi:hypothetical protein